MAFKTGTRIGGRGCPQCGSHDTEGMAKGGAQWCNTCRHKWLPCSPGCRGYRLSTDRREPAVMGCPDCRVPDYIVSWWPEAWKAMAIRLAELHDKLEPVVDPVDGTYQRLAR